MQGIDVSQYQGTIDWPAVKAAGIEFAIIRAGYGRLTSQEDPYFAQNYKGATAAGLLVGCYWFSYATTTSQAAEEAAACLSVIGNRAFPLGVWFDQEYVPAIEALTNHQRTEIVKMFLLSLSQAGFTSGLYCSLDWLQNRLETAQFAEENLWIAQYASQYTGPYEPNIWQYTSDWQVSGIQGRVDMDQLLSMPGGPAKPMPSLGEANLLQGSRGVFVRNLQTVLTALGNSPKGIDGIFGPNTRAAVVAFQSTHGLVTDGIVGPLTKAALEKAWSEKQ